MGKKYLSTHFKYESLKNENIYIYLYEIKGKCEDKKGHVTLTSCFYKSSVSKFKFKIILKKYVTFLNEVHE